MWDRLLPLYLQVLSAPNADPTSLITTAVIPPERTSQHVMCYIIHCIEGSETVHWVSQWSCAAWP